MFEFLVGMVIQWLANASLFAIKTGIVTAAAVYLFKRWRKP